MALWRSWGSIVAPRSPVSSDLNTAVTSSSSLSVSMSGWLVMLLVTFTSVTTDVDSSRKASYSCHIPHIFAECRNNENSPPAWRKKYLLTKFYWLYLVSSSLCLYCLLCFLELSNGDDSNFSTFVSSCFFYINHYHYYVLSYNHIVFVFIPESSHSS